MDDFGATRFVLRVSRAVDPPRDVADRLLVDLGEQEKFRTIDPAFPHLCLLHELELRDRRISSGG